MISSAADNNRRLEAGDLRSPWRWGFFLVMLAPVLGVTLIPAHGANLATDVGLCLICGEYGTANLIRNVVLFVPLGISLAVLLGPGRWALLVVLATTLTIETLQFQIPGRNPTLVDVATNFAGGAMSIGAIRGARWWAVAPNVRSAALSFGSALAASGILLGTAWMFTPELPRSDYWGQWTPRLGHMARYDGAVLSVSLNGTPVPRGRLQDSEGLRSALLGGASLHITAEAGGAPRGVAPIFAVQARGRREVLMLGAHRDHMVGRVRYRANRMRLDAPDVRFGGAMGRIGAGERVALSFALGPDGICLSLNGDVRCGLGPRMERGWALLKYVEGPPEWFRRLLDFGWMMGLVLPFGFFFRRHTLSYAGGLLLAGAVLSGWWLAPVAPPTALGLAGASGGLIVGVGLAFAVRRFRPEGLG